LRKNCFHARAITKTTLVRAKRASQLFAINQSQVEAISRLCLVTDQNFEDPPVIGGDEHVVRVSMREVAGQASKQHLDHVAHSAIVSAVGRVERYVHDWIHTQSFVSILATL